MRKRRNQGEVCDDCARELDLEFAIQLALVHVLSSHQLTAHLEVA